MYALLIRRLGRVAEPQACVQILALAAARRALATDAISPTAESHAEPSSLMLPASRAGHSSVDPLVVLNRYLDIKQFRNFWRVFESTDWGPQSRAAFSLAALACNEEAYRRQCEAHVGDYMVRRVDRLCAAMQQQGLPVPGTTRLALVEALCNVSRQDQAVQHLRHLRGSKLQSGAKKVWRRAFATGDVPTGEACQRLVGLMLPDQPPWVRAERIKQCGASGDAQGVQREWEAALVAAPTNPSDVLGLYSSRVMALARLGDSQQAFQAIRELVERVEAWATPESLRLSPSQKHSSILNLVYVAYEEVVTQGGRGLLGVAEWRQLITLLSQHGIPLHPRVFVTVMSRVEPDAEGRLRARAVTEMMRVAGVPPNFHIQNALRQLAAGDAEFGRESEAAWGVAAQVQQPVHTTAPTAAHGEHGGAPAGSQADAQADPAWVAHVAHTLRLERQLSAPDGLSSEGSVSKEEFVEQLVLALQACTAIPRPTPAKPLPPGTAAALQQLLQAAARQVHLLGAAAIVNAGRMWSHLLLPLDPAVRSALAARFMELLQRGEVPTRFLVRFLSAAGRDQTSVAPHQVASLARELARRTQTEGDAFPLRGLIKSLLALGRLAESGPELAEAVQTLARDGTLHQLSAAAEALLPTASHLELAYLMNSWSLMGWYPPMPLVSQVIERFVEAEGKGPSRQATACFLQGLGGLRRAQAPFKHPLMCLKYEGLAQSLLKWKTADWQLMTRALALFVELGFCPSEPTFAQLLDRLGRLPREAFLNAGGGRSHAADHCLSGVSQLAGYFLEAQALGAKLAEEMEADVEHLLGTGRVHRAAKAVQSLANLKVTSTAERLYPHVCRALELHAGAAQRSRNHKEHTDAAWRLLTARILLQQQGAEGLPPDPSWLQALQDDWWQHQRKEDKIVMVLQRLLSKLEVEAEVFHRTKDGWQIPIVLPQYNVALVPELRSRFFANTNKRIGFANMLLQITAAQWANSGTVVALPMHGLRVYSTKQHCEFELAWLRKQLNKAGLNLPHDPSVPSSCS